MAEEQFTQEQAASMARRLERAWTLYQDERIRLNKVSAVLGAVAERAQKNADFITGQLAEVGFDLIGDEEVLQQLGDQLNPEV